MNRLDQQSEPTGWLSSFLKELVSMPRRHMIVFVIATLLLILLEVEISQRWHVVHILDVMGVMLFLYLLWAAWRFRKKGSRSHAR